MFAFDCETYPIQPNLPVPKAVCMTWYRGGVWSLAGIQRPKIALGYLEDALDTPGEQIVGANVAFDLAVMVRVAYEQGCGERVIDKVFRAFEEGRIHDVLIEEKMRFLAKRGYIPEDTSLEKVAKKYAGRVLGGKRGLTAWRLRYNELDHLPCAEWPAPAVEYAVGDAVAAGEVFENTERVTNAAFQAGADFCFMLMRVWGMRVHEDRARALAARWEAESVVLTQTLKDVGILRESGTQDKAMVQTLVSLAYNGTPPMTDPTTKFPRGQVKTDKDTINDAPNPDNRLAVLIEYNKVQKNLSTYAAPVLDALTRTGTVHPWYNVLVKTGRSSCKQPNVQNQNQRSGIRECFIARPGYLLVGSDWNGQEDRSFTQVMVCMGLDPASAHRYRRDPNFDPHSSVGVALLNAGEGTDLTYQEFRAVLKGKDPGRVLPPVVTQALVKFYRQLAKVGVFGLPGGMVARTLVEYARGMDVLLTLEQAQAIEAAWREDDPARQVYLARAKARTRYGRLETHVQPFTGRVRANCKYTELCNTPFQGMTADGAKLALFYATWGCYVQDSPFGKDLYGARPWAFIHDEIILEAPVGTEQRVARGLKTAMDHGMALVHPDVPCVNEPVIMDTFSKDAESRILEDGSLEVWRHP